MFRSKTRNLIFPQSEHLRLVGAIALHWGNDQFALPPIDFNAFVTGVGLHDMGHGYFDENEIGAMDEPHRLRSMRNLAEATLADKSAELILQHHVLRLMGNATLYDSLRPTLKERIAANFNTVAAPEAIFHKIDRITELADMISFHFCFDAPVSNTIPVYAKWDDSSQIDVTYQIENGVILLDPWPLRIDIVEGYMMAFNADTYPNKLEPTLVAYQIRPK